MKVLIFMTRIHNPYGAERLGVELAEELNKRGVHADILSLYTEDLPGVPEAKQNLLHSGIPAVHFLGLKPHPPLVSLIPTIWKLRRLIRKNQYDIVETSQLSSTVLAAWATRSMSTRHVEGLHSAFAKERYNSNRHLIWRISVRMNKHVRFYAISDYVARHWVSYSKTAANRTRMILNAIPNDCFEALPDRDGVQEELGVPPDSRIALFVGRMLMRKGIDTILDAIGPLLKKENLCLAYVGGWDQPPEGFFAGEDGLLDRMRKRVAEEGWTDRVRFLGRRDDVPRLMASSDILVHPARIEGFGLVLAEAMAARLPVVASNMEGIPEVLAGTDSIMVPSDDPVALRKAVLKTLNRSHDEAREAIEKGRRRAEDFRIDNRIDAMIQLFEDVQNELF